MLTIIEDDRQKDEEKDRAKFSGFVSFGRDSPHWARTSSFTRFLDYTQRLTTVVRTPLDE
jgi:hypothetical protein